MLRDRIVARHRLRNVAVDVALVLAVDGSGSISKDDLALQFRSYAEAITSDVFMKAVRSGRHGRIALTFAAWSSARRQDQLVPWILIDGTSAARQFARDNSSFHTAVLENFVTEIAQIGAQSRSG